MQRGGRAQRGIAAAVDQLVDLREEFAFADAPAPALHVPGRPERLPLRAGTAGRERTPIFDEVASVWFREGTPGEGQSEDWQTTGDAGWRAAAASTEALATPRRPPAMPPMHAKPIGARARLKTVPGHKA